MRRLLPARLRNKIKGIRNLPMKLVRHRWLRHQSRTTDVGEVRTVCLALGPYRNLTTLTASLCGLHPNCQVLNHGGRLILKDRKLNFLADYTTERFDAFTRFAIHVAESSRKGIQWGGSIVGSHAFTRDAMKEAYEKRFGDSLEKEHVHSVFWKESLRTSNLIRRENVDLGQIFERNAKLRFLYPVRNPLDCAVSNLKTGHFRRFEGLDRRATLPQTLEAVLREFAWFLDLHDAFPDRFFYFYENEDIQQVAVSLARFLRVEPDPDWLEDVRTVYEVESSYQHAPDVVDRYTSLVKKQFANRPSTVEALLSFTGPEQPVA